MSAFDDGLDDRDKVGPADDGNGIYGHVLLCANRTRSDIAHMRTPGELEQAVEELDQWAKHTERKGWPLYGREKLKDRSGLALAPCRTKYWADK